VNGDRYTKGAASDAELLHGCGQTGKVMAPGNRHSDITSSTTKGMDPGMSATLGRPKASSDYKGSTPEDVSTAPGQRTTQVFGAGRVARPNPNNP
jgi:hypothetical protein